MRRGGQVALVSALLGLLGGLLLGLAGCAPPSSVPMSFDQFASAQRLSESNPVADENCGETCQSRRIEFRYVVYVGKEVYCYWPEKIADTGTDFDKLAQDLEKTIVDGVSLTDYFRTLRKWAGSFHDGHVNAMPPAELSGFDVYSAPIRVDVFNVATPEEKIIVTDSSVRGQIDPGDELVAINGKPVRQALDEAVREASGSTAAMRRWGATRRLVDALGATAGAQPLEVEVIHRNQRVVVPLFRRITVTAPSAPGGGSAAKPADEPTGAENVKATVLPGGLGYMRIDAFIGSQSDAVFDEVMRSLEGTKGLLLDLRANGGGDLSGNRIIGRLITSAVSRYDRSERLSPFAVAMRPEIFEELNKIGLGSLFAAWHPVTVKPIADRSYLGKPVVALTSTYCFSACDTFVSGLKANGLAEVAGQATGGGTGTPLVFDLPTSGFKFRYSIVRGRTARGDAIEGVGTKPDIPIEPSIADIGTPRDSQLARALAVLAERAGVGAVAAPAIAESVGKTFGLARSQRTDVAPTVDEVRRLRDVWGVDEVGARR